MGDGNFLSVIVVTHNRVGELMNCLDSLSDQVREFDDVEVVVVDNASTDGTGEAVPRRASELGHRCRYVREPELGLCKARNAGRNAARGEVLTYIDDDVVVGPGWVSQVRGHFLSRRSDCLAGKVRVKVAGGLPDWFPPQFLYILGETTLGEETRSVAYPEHPQGNNFAVRAEVFDTIGGFNPKIKYYGDEAEFFRRVGGQSFSTLYRPEIVVDHCIPASRVTKTAVMRKAYLLGRGSAFLWLLTAPGGVRRVRRATEYFLRLLYNGVVRFLRPSFQRRFTFWEVYGYLRQLIKGVA